MGSATSHEISEKGLQVISHYYIIRVWSEKFLFRVFQCCFVEGNQKSISDTLIDNGFSVGENGDFTQKEVEKLSSDNPRNIDISLLSKFCQKLWEKGVNYPSDKLKQLIIQIENMRQSCCGDNNFLPGELKRNLETFESVFREAINESLVLCDCHKVNFLKMKTDLYFSIKEEESTLKKFIASNPERRVKYQVELKLYGKLLYDCIRENLILEGETILRNSKDSRKKSCESLVENYSFDPNIFSEPFLMDLQDSYGRHNVEEQNDFLSVKNCSGRDSTVIILNDKLGAEKTDVLYSLGEKWFKNMKGNRSSLAPNELLLYIKYRNRGPDNLEEYLSSLFPNQMKEFGVRFVGGTIQHSRLIVLFEDYNDQSKNSKKLFKEIVAFDCVSNKVFVTECKT